MTIMVNGRYPHKGNLKLESENMIVELSRSGDDIEIRVDDKENLEFWLQIIIPKDDIDKLVP